MIIGLCGYTGVGKDEVAKILVSELGFVRIAFADAMRNDLYKLNPYVGVIHRLQDIVDFMGWDEAKRKYPEIRRLLMVYGTEIGRDGFGKDVWISRALRNVSGVSSLVLTDVRFDNEVRTIQAYYGRLIHVTRPGHGPINNHASEQLDYATVADATIDNSGTLDDLRTKVLECVNG